MKLLFWKSTSKPKPVLIPNISIPKEIEGVEKTQRSEDEAAERQSIAVTPRYRILPLKTWCEEELTPLAWSRIVIRMLPILRDFNCNFSSVQNPTKHTTVEKELFKLFLATVEEIYGKSYLEYLKSKKQPA